MKLHEGTMGRTYLVKGVVVDDTITRRLEALGVNEETPVTILNKKGSGSVIFKVRGTRLAVGRRISDGIQIREVPEDAGHRPGGQPHYKQPLHSERSIQARQEGRSLHVQ